MRAPHLEHLRHRDYVRTSRSPALREWIAARATALSYTGAEMFNQLKRKGSDALARATTSIPVVRTKPTITGTTTSGQTLTRVVGTYGGAPAATLTRQWLRDGVAISGATGTTLVLSAPDVGHKISITETATNTAGAVSSTSNQTATVAA